MRRVVEQLEELDTGLRKTDPGDVAVLTSLLQKRGIALSRLAELCAAGEGHEELLPRLQAISLGMADVYRGVVLERLSIVQQQAMLERKRELLETVSGTLDQRCRPRLLNEQG